MRRYYSAYGYSGDNPVRYDDPVTRVQHVADQRHAIVQGDDAGTPWVISAPPLPPVEQADPYVGGDWITAAPEVAEIDQTVYRTHEGRDTYPVQPNRQAQQRVSGAAHAEDVGAAADFAWAAPPIRMPDEQQVIIYQHGFGPNDRLGVSDAALKRGLNSLPENNPDGYRAGVDRLTFFFRRFMIAERVHDSRPVMPNTVTVLGNVPSKGVPIAPTFASQARAIANVWQRPFQRREPEGLTQSMLSDGMAGSYRPADPPSIANEWVVG